MTRDILAEERFSINPKVILFIILTVIVFQIILTTKYEFDGGIAFSDIIILSAFASVSITSCIIGIKYQFSNVFGKSYFALGIGAALTIIGEIVYLHYESIGVTPYPSVADVFLFSAYFFIAYHLKKNITFFSNGLSNNLKALFACMVILLISCYVYFSLDSIWSFDFAYGFAFVFISSCIFSLAVIGVILLRSSLLVTTWTLLAFSLFLYIIADMWYYNAELYGVYDYGHPVNSLWLASSFFMIYALIKHLKAL